MPHRPMPTFECDTCGDSFTSRTKLEQHRAAQHTDDGSSAEGMSGYIEGLKNMFTLKGGLTLIGIILMIALPLGGTAYYSSLAPEQGDSDSSSDITSNPPTGQNIQRIPTQPRAFQLRTNYDQELSTDEQLYLLYQGGPDIGVQGIQPSFLLQYDCTDCTELIEQVEQFSSEINGGSEVWVRTAPNTGLDDRIAVTFPAHLTRSVPQTYESFNATEVRSFICGLTIGGGQQQYSMESIGPAACAF